MRRHFFGHFFTAERLLAISILSMLLATAFFVRFWNIEHLPAGLYPDEAMNGIDALRANETGNYQLFYPNNSGREGLYINLQALSLFLFGANITALKLWSAIFGTATVLGVYLLAKELWQKRSVALFSAFLVTFSYWAINFSRIGFRAIMVPFILSFSFYFFFRGLRTKSLFSFLVSGFIFGLGFHTYIAFRVAPLILLIITLGCMASYREFLKRYWKHALVFTIGMFVTALPLIYEFATHPEYLSSRSASISILSPAVNHGHLALTLAKTLSLSLIKYTFVGDMNWRHNYPPYPLLDLVSGTLFLAGFVFLIMRVILLAKKRWKHAERNRELMISLFLLGWFFTMLIPEFLTGEGLPHALRAIGTQPVVFLIASLPLLWFGEWLRKQAPGSKVGMVILVGTAIALIPLWNVSKYFLFFANNPNARGAFNENFTAMAQYINGLPDNTHTYVLANAGGTMIDNGLPITAQPILFLTHDSAKGSPEFLMPDTILQMPAVIIPQKWDDAVGKKVQSAFPQATTEPVPFGKNSSESFQIIVIK